MRMYGSEALSRAENRRTLALVALCLSLGFLATPIRPGIVLGESMAPTFRSGQVFLMSQTRDASPVERSDVVLFDLDGQMYLKRVYAIAGDEVWGVVDVGEQGLLSRVVAESELDQTDEFLRQHPGLGELARVSVPPDCVFVLGDAAADSYDSRHFGPIPVSAIRGRVVVPRLLSLWNPDGPGRGVALAGDAPPR